MKKVLVLLSVVALASVVSPPVYAATIADDFNDGNTDGWVAAKPCSYCGEGNWRLEDGVLVEDQGKDGYMFLLEDYTASDQSVQASILNHDNGQAGLTVWYQDYDNYVQVDYPYYSGSWGFRFKEMVNGSHVVTHYPFDFGPRVWGTLRLDTNSTTGEIAIYFDGKYVTTYTATTTKREGLSGFNSGNAGGSFDDFKLVIPDQDTDGDGVLDTEDQCPNTTVDTWGKALGINRWQVMDNPQYGWYQNKLGRKRKLELIYGHDMSCTYGCSGNQILDLISDARDNKHGGLPRFKRLKGMFGTLVIKNMYKFGLTTPALEWFHQKFGP